MGKVINLFSNDRGGTMMSRKTTIYDVANYFLSRVDRASGSYLTHLKLQKLTYYAQAWSLVWDDKELFKNEFEAWAHGPVNPDLFQNYKRYGMRSLPGPEQFDVTNFDKNEIATLDAVWEAYGIYDAKYLESLTHQENPWLIARGNTSPGERCNAIITKSSMKEFYSKF